MIVVAMDHSNSTVTESVRSSGARLDYGSTALNSSAPANNIEDGTASLNATLNQDNAGIYSSTSDLYSPSTEPDRHRRRNPFATIYSYVTNMTMDTLPNSETRQIMQRLEFFLNVVNQACIGFVSIYLSWMCLSVGLAKTALHAWLVTIGFCLLMAEGIMCHYSGNVLTHNYKRTTKTTIHWVLQALGGTLGVAGILIKCIQKGFLIQSTHGKLGFAAFILCVISMLSGLTALFSMRFKHMISPLLNKSFHNLLGIATFVIAMMAQFYGYKTGFFSRKVDPSFQTMIEWITIVAMVLTCIGPLKAMYNKLKNISRHFR